MIGIRSHPGKFGDLGLADPPWGRALAAYQGQAAAAARAGEVRAMSGGPSTERNCSRPPEFRLASSRLPSLS